MDLEITSKQKPLRAHCRGLKILPKKVPLDLYAEQISGTAFTAPRADNRRSWVYRIRPSVVHGEFKEVAFGQWAGAAESVHTPNRLRWDPLLESKSPADFLDGLVTMVVSGSAESRIGVAVHLYQANKAMTGRYFYNSDAEMVFLPEAGAILIRTEMGEIDAAPGEMVVVPRGIKFAVSPLKGGSIRGYVAENFGEAFRLPGLGPIGANGLADPRHFLTPKAKFEDRTGSFTLLTRYQGKVWQAAIDRSPLDVVAWQGNYAPYKYDLALFQPVNTVSVDHPDPSIFTVLTSPSAIPGTANCDFVIFPPRWMVAQHTFRPPYFHRNLMSEYMGLIKGKYDAKQEGFVPGGGSLHNAFSAHGPDADTYEKAVSATDDPQYQAQTLAFMFESQLPYRVSKSALALPTLQKNYTDCWQALKAHNAMVVS